MLAEKNVKTDHLIKKKPRDSIDEIKNFLCKLPLKNSKICFA